MLTLTKGPKRARTSLLSPEDGNRPSFQNIVSSTTLDKVVEIIYSSTTVVRATCKVLPFEGTDELTQQYDTHINFVALVEIL
jgi:hypothetical protein